MRETHNTQSSIFDVYTEHELGDRLRQLSKLRDFHPEILSLIEWDLRTGDTTRTGAKGLSVETVFLCLLLKQILQHSYEKLAFPSHRFFLQC